MLPNFEAPRMAKNLQPDTITQSPDPTCTRGSPNPSESFSNAIYTLKSKLDNSSKPGLIVDSSHWKRLGNDGEDPWKPKQQNLRRTSYAPSVSKSSSVESCSMDWQLNTNASQNFKPSTTNGQNFCRTHITASITYRTSRALLDHQSRLKIDTLCVEVVKGLPIKL